MTPSPPLDTSLASANLADGTRKSLVLDPHGWFVVTHHRSDEDGRVVTKTPERDRAEAIYAAFDGDRPWHDAYLPRGFNERDTEKKVVVYAVGGGDTPEAAALAAVRALLDSLGSDLDPTSLDPIDGDDDRDFQWGYRFRDTGTGTSFKAAGRYVPGGAIVTWWK